MPYTVQQLAAAAGVTPRTLRFYDRAGLLLPAARAKNGYRAYGDAERRRLQQILFFRELDFPLAEIKRILDHPDFRLEEALLYQKRLLLLKKKRLETIVRTIDKTLKAMSAAQSVDDRDLYGSLTTEEIEARKKEAEARWGHTSAYRQSQERVKAFTKADWQAIQQDTDANLRALVALLEAGKAPESPEVQAQIAIHRHGINRFYDCTDEIYLGLAEMYVADDRFAETYRKYHPELPAFLARAMKASCAGKKPRG